MGKTLFSGETSVAFLTPFENCGTKNEVLAVVDAAQTVSPLLTRNLLILFSAAYLSVM